MAPVGIQHVVSFSSQDDKFEVKNLVNGTGKWLSHKSDRSGRIEAVLQLSKSTVISHIDVGAYWCFTVEIQVGRSSSPASYVPFVPSCCFMKSKFDCQVGNKKEAVRMFKYDDFDKSERDNQWDRIKIICTQPFKKDVQFGLSFLRFKSSEGILSPKSQNSSKCKNTSTVKSASDIQKHFFGHRTSPERDGSSSVKSKLIQIGSSGENTAANQAELARSTKLVMAACKQTPKYKGPGTNSPRTSRTYVDASGGEKSRELSASAKISFQEEATGFLKTVNFKEIDLENMEISELRHRLEKQKNRKLSKEEKKIFLKLTRDYAMKYMNGPNESEDKDKTDESTKHDSEIVDIVNQPSATSLNPNPSKSEQVKKRVKGSNFQVSSPVFNLQSNFQTSTPVRHQTKTDSSCSEKLLSVAPKPSPIHSRNSSANRSQNFALDTENLNLQLSQLETSPSYKNDTQSESQTFNLELSLSENSGTIDCESSNITQDLEISQHLETLDSILSKAKRKQRRKKKGKKSNSFSQSQQNDTSFAERTFEVEQCDVLPSTPASCTSKVLEIPSNVGKLTHGKKRKIIELDDEGISQPSKKYKETTIGNLENSALSSPEPTVDLVECPLCSIKLPVLEIERHAAVCQGPDESPCNIVMDDREACPICFRRFPVTLLQGHANICMLNAEVT